ncbi:MAG: DUF4382 domain-containing protein [archaeon]
MKNVYKSGIFLVLCLAALLLVFGCTTPGPATGKLVVGITDATADIENVSKIEVTISQVQVQSETEGWITLSSTPKTYDLLQLKADGTTVLLADANLNSGAYNQLRLVISKVMVTDANGTFEAKLPSNELKFAGGFDVNAGKVSVATIDFKADRSLHVTGKGEYILAPVVHLKISKDSSIEVNVDEELEIEDGEIEVENDQGMDINGNVEIDVEIDENEELEIDDKGKIFSKQEIEANGRIVVGITDAKGDLNTVTSIMLSISKIEVQAAESTEGWITISSSPQTFDLLLLESQQKTELAADANVEAGSYDKVRLTISKVEVTDENGTTEAKLPSNVLKINADLEVNASTTAVAVLDFNAGASMHKTGDGNYILTPVIRVTTKVNADVNVKVDNSIEIKGGTARTDNEVGMNAEGEVNIGAKIPDNAKIIIDERGIITID